MAYIKYVKIVCEKDICYKNLLFNIGLPLLLLEQWS